MTNSYDIFISYKRKSLPTANNLYYRLTIRGYSTFFDLEEMGRDNFNTQLLKYIENAKDVFVILEEGSLDGCKHENWGKEDWFCHEIAFALEKEKNIIPILLNGYKMPSEDFFPNKLKELSFKNAPEFNFSFFEAYLDKLVEKEYLLSKPHLQEKFTSVFKFYSNEDCQVFKEGKLVCSLEGMSDEPYYLPVPRKGDYRFKVQNFITTEFQLLKVHIDVDEEREVEITWENEVKHNITNDVACDNVVGSENKSEVDSDKKLSAVEIDGKCGFVDEKGKVVIPAQWIFASDFFDGLALVENDDGVYGYIDEKGTMVIPCQWHNALRFVEGLAAVEDFENKWGYIDKKGKVVIPCQWNYALWFSEGLAAVKDIENKWGYIDKKGEVKIPCQLDDGMWFREGLARVMDDKSDYGYIDRSGSVVISCQWKEAEAFSEGLALVKSRSGKYGYIDTLGNSAIPFIWKDGLDFSEGLAGVQNDSGLWGFINKSGRVVIPCQWKYAESFKNGLAIVTNQNGKCGYLNKKGEITIPCQWDGAWDFNSGGVAVVWDDNNVKHFINKTGKLLW